MKSIVCGAGVVGSSIAEKLSSEGFIKIQRRLKRIIKIKNCESFG